MKFLSAITSIALALTAVWPAGLSSLSRSARTEDAAAPLLSPGLSVIAAATELVTSTTPSDEAVLTRSDFARAVGYEPASITVVSLPDAADGQLLSGSVVVPVGQTLTGADIARLAFVPSRGAESGTSAVFCFRADDAPYDYTCRIMIDERASSDAAPTLACATAAACAASTYTGRECSGLLAGADADGDALIYELVSYPAHGSVVLTGSDPERGTAGHFVYRPLGNFAGHDSFSYTVRDSLGKYAADSVTVAVTVARSSLSVDYADMSGAAECAALTATAAGLMNGKQVGAEYYFEPTREVCRGEFLVMLMRAAGITDLPEVDATPFADDAEIPSGMKPYAAAAFALGWTDGWIVDGKQCFLPSEPIPAAEAAVLTASVLGISVDGAIEVCAGGAPSWARSAVAALTAGGIPLTGFSGLPVRAGAPLDRASCAALLCSVRESRR